MVNVTAQDMRNKMLVIMVKALDDIANGLQFSADSKLRLVRDWLKVMKLLMPPDEAEKSFGDIMRRLEEIDRG